VELQAMHMGITKKDKSLQTESTLADPFRLRRVSMGLTVSRKTARNLAVRRKNERTLTVSRKKILTTK